MKKIGVFILLVLLMSGTKAQEKYQATWESLSKYQIPDWFRDAKFGIFIHWGVYSVPGYSSEWYPRNMYQVGSPEYKHHMETYGPQSKFGYKDFIPLFRAKKFDPHAWVTLFKSAGAKYVVPVAEHHDGFAMYKSSLTPWNAFEMGPHRDIIGELAAEVKKQGLIFGVSSHRIEHWWFFNGGRKFDSDVADPKNEAFYGPACDEEDTMSPEFMNDWLSRTMELVNNYKPQLVWFDWWIKQPALEPYKKSFAQFYYNKAREWDLDVVINYKNDAFPENVAVLDLERGKLSDIRSMAWQTDDAIGNDSWGFTNTNTFKDVRYVITNLVDIVSKNGNLLLNIGPKPDGTIGDAETKVLTGTGIWLQENGEAIYGTRPWKVYGEGPTKSASGAFKDQKEPFTWQDVRFTTRDSILYITALGIPEGQLSIKALALKAGNGKIADIKLLGSDEKINWKQKDDELIIEPLKTYQSEYAVSWLVTFVK